MIVDIDKGALKYFRNYLSFQRDGSYHDGLRMNLEKFIEENKLSDIIPEIVDGISKVLYKNVDIPVLDVFFNQIGDFKPWMRLNVLVDKLYIAGGPDQYTYEILADDPCIGNWTGRLYLQTEFMQELLSVKHPEVKRVYTKQDNYRHDSITLNTDSFVSLDNKPIIPNYVRVQILPLDKFDRFFELVHGVNEDDINSFEHKTLISNFPIPYESICNLYLEKPEKKWSVGSYFRKGYDKVLRCLFKPIGKER